jgi:hypothetical protein
MLTLTILRTKLIAPSHIFLKRRCDEKSVQKKLHTHNQLKVISKPNIYISTHVKNTIWF